MDANPMCKRSFTGKLDKYYVNFINLVKPGHIKYDLRGQELIRVGKREFAVKVCSTLMFQPNVKWDLTGYYPHQLSTNLNQLKLLMRVNESRCDLTKREWNLIFLGQSESPDPYQSK